MNKKNFTTHYRSLFLLSSCLVLLGAVYVEWKIFNAPQKKEVTKRVADTTNLFDNLSDYQDNLLPKNEYENITSAPVFIEGRVAIKRDDNSQIQGSSDFKLKGVILNGPNLLALISDSQNHQFRLKVGEQANGWTVISVQKDNVELKKDEQSQHLSLTEDKKNSNLPVQQNDFGMQSEQDPRGYYKPNFY